MGKKFADLSYCGSTIIWLAVTLLAAMPIAFAQLPATGPGAVSGEPSTAAPAAASSAPAIVTSGAAIAPTSANPESDYKIGSQDLIDIQVWGQPDLARTVRVNVQGKVSLPLIGALDVVGLTAQQVERLIAARLSEKYLQDPQVTVFIKEFTTLRFTVEGAVNKPGVYPLVGQMTLLRALAVAGGQGQLSDLSQVILFRVYGPGQRTTSTFDVDKVRSGEVADPLLQNDDLVVVNRSKSRVAIKDSLFRDIVEVFNPLNYLRPF